MGVNTTGTGYAIPPSTSGFNGGGYNPSAPAPYTSGAGAAQPRSSGGIPSSVGGQQYAQPGAAGVTSYGLFSGARRSVLPPPAPQQPGMNAPIGFNPPQMLNPRGGTPLPPGINPTQMQGSLTAQRTMNPLPPIGYAHPTSMIGSLASPRLQPPQNGGFGLAPRQTVGGTSGLALPATSTPTNMKAFASGDATNDTALNPVNADGTQSDGQTGQDVPPNADQQAQQQGAGTTAAQVANGNVNGVVGDLAGGVGSIAGTGIADFIKAYNQATGGGSSKSFFDFLQNIPGFQQSSLSNDVGQNMTSMMDPAAWQQMAQNREQAADFQNLGALNTQERRMADSQGRTGFANPGGVTGQMYADYANRGLQSHRDIFNDTLKNQMGAIGQAGQYALGQSAQDQQRWSQLTGLAGTGAQQDYQANREDNPSGSAVLQDLLAALGGVGKAVGNTAGSASSMMGMLLPLLMA